MDYGMDRVFPKPFPIRDFGKMLVNLNYIKDLPEHMKVDTENED